MNRLLYLFSLLSIVFIITSCQTTNKYGSRHSRFSSERIANFGGEKASKKRSTKRRSTRSYAGATKKKRTTTHKSRSTTPSKSTASSVRKVRYHSERTSILRDAQKYKGVPYVYGGKKPSQGFDCSGFVTYVFKQNQIYINGSAASLSAMGRKKDPKELNPGDLVFFGEGNKVTHVGIVSMNDGKNLTMIHSSSSAGIRSDNIYFSDYWSKRLLYGVDIVSSHFEEDLGMK